MPTTSATHNTSIALGALFGVLFADNLGVTSVVWFGVALTAASLLLNLSVSRRTTPRTVVDGELVTSS